MKIIASDYDGTLKHNGISDADRDAITKFRKEGNKFGIVTGRCTEQALWVMYDLKKAQLEVDFIICCTGAVILNSDGTIRQKKTAKVTNELKKLTDKAQELEVRSMNINNCLKATFLDPQNKIPLNLEEIGELTQINSWFESEDNAREFCSYVNENLGNLLNAFQNGGSVDIPPAGVSKVTGVYDYAGAFDSPEIYAVGDNTNDIPMLKEFEGYAVSNAREQVKAVAKHQCDRIADMIEEIMKGSN
ncbi:MAG: HAD-IIB family hydrolase [Clostridia bacterium]|nr:HAD-IIB family hydrolase [Clostridia bacterium]